MCVGVFMHSLCICVYVYICVYISLYMCLCICANTVYGVFIHIYMCVHVCYGLSITLETRLIIGLKAILNTIISFFFFSAYVFLQYFPASV